jgi:site-specific DNA recombinase
MIALVFFSFRTISRALRNNPRTRSAPTPAYISMYCTNVWVSIILVGQYNNRTKRGEWKGVNQVALAKKKKALTPTVNIASNKVATYVRWSTEEQGEGTTLTTQLEKCGHYILSQDWKQNENLIYIDDGFSGGSLDRPAMNKLRQDVADGLVDCVVIFKLDRLSRSIVDTVNLVLDEWDDICYIKSVIEPFDTSQQIGRQILTMLAGFAEWERYNIKLRTFEGKYETAQLGRNAGFKAPYGYVVGEITGTFEIVPEEADIVRRIFRDYRNGQGRASITHTLNSEGILFRKGRSWNDSTVAHILANQLYIGRLVWGKLQRNNKRTKREGEPFWNRREVPLADILMTEEIICPIITVEEFEEVRKIRESRDVFKDRRISAKSFTSPHLLSGILKCKCGHGMTARKQQGTDNYSYYMCRGNKTKGSDFCDCGYLRQDWIDSVIITEIKEKFVNGKDSLAQIAQEDHTNRTAELTQSLSSINQQLEELVKQLNDLKTDYRKREISAKNYEMFESEILSDTAKLEAIKAEVQDGLATLDSMKVDTMDLSIFATALENWDKMTVEEQKQLLFKWVNSVVAYKKKGKENKDLEITIDYKTNIELQSSVHSLASNF